MSQTPQTRDALADRDAADPLRPFRAEFDLPDGVIYLDGNSLGALPKAAAARVARTVGEEWGRGLIRSWNAHRWIDMPARIGGKVARLIGAAEDEVVVADSTSVNLFKMLAAALQLRPGRTAILTDETNFPTDLYIAQGLIEMLGARHELRRVPPADVVAAIGDDTAVVMLTQVDYRSGAICDLETVTAAAHARGALMLWDLSHSAGALPVDLNAAEADFAVGCGYKYLNGGPGAPAFLFVARRHQDLIRPPLSGWMGHAAPFAFDGDYRPAPGIARNLAGTPPVLAMAALEEGIDLALRADMRLVREKSMALTALFVDLVERDCAGFGFALASPRDPARRASQVSLRHENGYPIVQALIARGVIGDFRSPDILRFGFAPLYLRYVDVWDAVAALKDVMATRDWDRPEFHARAAVT